MKVDEGGMDEGEWRRMKMNECVWERKVIWKWMRVYKAYEGHMKMKGV